MLRYEIEYEFTDWDIDEFIDENGDPYEEEVPSTNVDWITVDALDKDDAIQQAYEALYDREGVSVVDATLVEDDED